MGHRQASGIVVLRVLLGVFFFSLGLNKVGWFSEPSHLSGQLGDYLAASGPLNRWYLESVCIPGVAIFARVVPAAELLTGIALFLGVYTRLVSILALLMVVNFAFASSQILRVSYLSNGYGLPVLGGLLALAIGGASLPFSLKR
jgi:uncharacterized membrane protein YphA (DoxX/SURF4 family)